jgi:hypothetical protein
MKKELTKGFAMVTVNAQSANKVVADIPFEFSVGYKTMPAGEYQVRMISSAGSSLMIQSADSTVSALRLSESTEQKKDNHTRLVFHRYGERYFLAEVWNGAELTGRRLLKSQEERAIESELAASQGEIAKNAFEIVEVVAMNR